MNSNDILKSKSKKDIIRDLSNLSQKDKNEKLFDAAYDGYLDKVKLLIEAGANVNAENEFGNTALMLASINNNIDIVKLLKSYGAK